MNVLSQFGLGGDNWLISFILLLIFWVVVLPLYPRLMLSQILWGLNRTTENIEYMSRKSKDYIIKKISKKPSKKLKESMNRFFEFFVIEPVNLDPYGIVKKLDHIIKNEEERFEYFVDNIAPHMNSEEKANLRMGIAGGIELYMIAKIMRHYVETIKETKSYPLAVALQMQLPFIEKIAKALYSGTKTLADGNPIGDAIGCLVAADIIGNKKVKEIEKDTIMVETNIEGRRVFVIKAKGPGGRIGRPGEAVEKISKKYKIARIITIDAAAKLEGEKTGSVAEGVGVAIGGIGTDKSFIEDVAVKNKIPLDSIIIKMKAEEAIMPMKKDIKDAVPKVIELVKESVKRAKKGEIVIVVGVGNTSGVGNSSKEAEKAKKWVDKYEKKMKVKKKKFGF